MADSVIQITNNPDWNEGVVSYIQDCELIDEQYETAPNVLTAKRYGVSMYEQTELLNHIRYLEKRFKKGTTIRSIAV